MRALYLHPAAAFGGASKSLIELFGLLKERGVVGTVLSPSGAACLAFKQAGLEVHSVKGLSQFDNTRYGHYRGLRWLILLRELYFLPSSLLALWRLRGGRFDLLHVNEVTLLPLGIVAKWLLGVPMVVHVRSLQRKPGTDWRTWLVNRWLGRHADAVVAIDHTVASTLDPALPIAVVHNGLNISATAALRPSGEGGPVRIGFLGVLIPLKGVYELVEAMRILVKERGLNVECLIAGENAREVSGLKALLLRKLGFARDVRGELSQLIELHDLQEQVRLLGFVGDVRALYPRLDIICFPSHLDAAGRPVFEAAFYSIPSVVAVADPLPDSVINGVTGLAVRGPDPVAIADALQRLAEDPAYRRTLGLQARAWAEANFAVDRNALLMYEVYCRALSRSCVATSD